MNENWILIEFFWNYPTINWNAKKFNLYFHCDVQFQTSKDPNHRRLVSATDTASIEGVKYIRCIDAIIDNSDAISTSSKDMDVINVIQSSDLFGQLPRVRAAAGLTPAWIWIFMLNWTIDGSHLDVIKRTAADQQTSGAPPLAILEDKRGSHIQNSTSSVSKIFSNMVSGKTCRQYQTCSVS